VGDLVVASEWDILEQSRGDCDQINFFSRAQRGSGIIRRSAQNMVRL
jgi:hypothetical protein